MTKDWNDPAKVLFLGAHLSSGAMDEFDAALDAFPGQIIATHTADWAAARLDESEVSND